MTPFNFQIHSLRDFPEFADDCAAWSYGEWTSQSRLRSLQDVVNLYQKRAVSIELPQTWVAVRNDKPIGMVTLKASGEHPDITDDTGPWLSSLHVHPYFRNRGVAAQLMKKCEDEAKKTYGFNILYLFTGSEAFYNKSAWERIKTVRDPADLHPDGCVLMKKDLA